VYTYVHERAETEGCENLYSASDMFPLTHALQYLGFEVSDACARDLSAALVRSKNTKQIVEITPPVQGANIAAP